MKYREKQDKGTFLTAGLKSRKFQGMYFSSENLELYSYCSILELKLFCIPPLSWNILQVNRAGTGTIR